MRKEGKIYGVITLVLILLGVTISLNAQQISYAKNSSLYQPSGRILLLSEADDPCVILDTIPMIVGNPRRLCHAVDPATGDYYLSHVNDDSLFISRLIDKETGATELLFSESRINSLNILDDICYLSSNAILVTGGDRYLVYDLLSGEANLSVAPGYFFSDFWHCGEYLMFVDVYLDLYIYDTSNIYNSIYLGNLLSGNLITSTPINIDCIGRCLSDFRLVIRDLRSIEYLKLSDFTSEMYCEFGNSGDTTDGDVEVQQYDLWLDLDETDEVCFSPDLEVESPCILTDIGLSAAMPHIFSTPYSIDSLTASISEASSTLSITAMSIGADMVIEGSGTADITWRNTGAATFDQFYQAIQSVVYHNTDSEAQADTVVIEFYVYDDGNVSEVATAYLYLGYDIQYAGMDMMVHLCKDSGVTDLNQFVSASHAGGYWEPSNLVDAQSDISSTYQYILSSDCDSDTALYMVEISTMPDIQPRDTMLCYGDSLLYEGNYYYEATTLSNLILDEYGCDSIVEELMLTFTAPAIYVEQDTTLCYGDSIFLGSEYIYTESSIEIIIDGVTTCDSVRTLFNIYFEEAPKLQIVDTLFCVGDSLLIDGVYYDQAMDFTVSQYNVQGCDSIITEYHLMHYTTAEYQLLVEGDLCVDETVSITLIGPDATDVLWSTGADVNSISVSQSGNYTVTVTGVDGCQTELSSQIDDPIYPAFSGVLDYVFYGTDTTFTPDLTIDNYNEIIWTPATGLSCTDCPNPEIHAISDINYTLTVSSESGCTTALVINVEQIEDTPSELVLPNIFSPQSSNLANRYFYFPYTTIAQYDMSIYDRWGEQVFSKNSIISNTAEAGWDGNYKGAAAMSGVYVYHIQYVQNGVAQSIVGTLTLVR